MDPFKRFRDTSKADNPDGDNLMDPELTFLGEKCLQKFNDLQKKLGIDTF